MQKFASIWSTTTDAVLFAAAVKVCRLVSLDTPGDMFDFNTRKYKHSVKSVTSSVLALFQVASPNIVNVPVCPFCPKPYKMDTLIFMFSIRLIYIDILYVCWLRSISDACFIIIFYDTVLPVVIYKTVQTCKRSWSRISLFAAYSFVLELYLMACSR